MPTVYHGFGVNFEMTIHLGDVLIICTIMGAFYAGLLVAQRAYQWIELATKTMLWAARQQGMEIPEWLANQYKRINGNATASRQEKHDLLGPENDSNGDVELTAREN